MRIPALFLILLLSTPPLFAAERMEGPPPAFLNALACRIAERSTGSSLVITALADVRLDTMSRKREKASVHARLHNGQVLTAIVQHVYVRLPRDRFNITLLLDDRPHLRLNHVDLDIFAETTVDGRSYLLHCFRDIDPGQLGNDE